MLRFLKFFVFTALACWMPRPPLGPFDEGSLQKAPRILHRALTNSGQPNQWAGRVDLSSGTAFVTVSTRMVKSDSIINYGVSVATTVGSGFSFAVGVSSVVDGVSFALGFHDNVGRGPTRTFMWEIKRV